MIVGINQMKKNIFTTVLFSLVLCLASMFCTAKSVDSSTAAASAQQTIPQMPRIFANARFVYVTAYDGDQFNPNLLPEDREAISLVQDAVQKWGKLIVVYKPEQADIILAVQSRPSEDVLAVYDAHNGDATSRPSQTFLWRVMARGGLQKSETPLIAQFEKAWQQIAN
jgi:hypothetical protein